VPTKQGNLVVVVGEEVRPVAIVLGSHVDTVAGRNITVNVAQKLMLNLTVIVFEKWNSVLNVGHSIINVIRMTFTIFANGNQNAPDVEVNN
jgi:hypothetical protein